MADYKTIHGTTVKSYTTDPDNPIEGQVWYDKTNEVLQYQIPNLLSSWRTANIMNTTRGQGASNGTQTSAIIYGGDTVNTETYDGTTFTEVANLNTQRRITGGS